MATAAAAEAATDGVFQARFFVHSHPVILRGVLAGSANLLNSSRINSERGTLEAMAREDPGTELEVN